MTNESPEVYMLLTPDKKILWVGGAAHWLPTDVVAWCCRAWASRWRSAPYDVDITGCFYYMTARY